jgi:hypothetical protein
MKPSRTERKDGESWKRISVDWFEVYPANEWFAGWVGGGCVTLMWSDSHRNSSVADWWVSKGQLAHG